MKTLLTITVLFSSVLSIFSSSLAIFEMPVFKESLYVIEKGKDVQRSDVKKDSVRIYIPHDVSNRSKEEPTPLITAKKKVNASKPA